MLTFLLGVLKNFKTLIPYENSLDDLQLICDTYIEDLIKTEEPKLLGEYIEKTDERNVNNKYNSCSLKSGTIIKGYAKRYM
jgi:type I restriction enzyme S subunit